MCDYRPKRATAGSSPVRCVETNPGLTQDTFRRTFLYILPCGLHHGNLKAPHTFAVLNLDSKTIILRSESMISSMNIRTQDSEIMFLSALFIYSSVSALLVLFCRPDYHHVRTSIWIEGCISGSVSDKYVIRFRSLVADSRWYLPTRSSPM